FGWVGGCGQVRRGKRHVYVLGGAEKHQILWGRTRSIRTTVWRNVPQAATDRASLGGGEARLTFAAASEVSLDTSDDTLMKHARQRCACRPSVVNYCRWTQDGKREDRRAQEARRLSSAPSPTWWERRRTLSCDLEARRGKGSERLWKTHAAENRHRQGRSEKSKGGRRWHHRSW
ncbi:unnamed protein product, partial [Ectocarpus sp. 12 AP-2014]